MRSGSGGDCRLNWRSPPERVRVDGLGVVFSGGSGSGSSSSSSQGNRNMSEQADPGLLTNTRQRKTPHLSSALGDVNTTQLHVDTVTHKRIQTTHAHTQTLCGYYGNSDSSQSAATLFHHGLKAAFNCTMRDCSRVWNESRPSAAHRFLMGSCSWRFPTIHLSGVLHVLRNP